MTDLEITKLCAEAMGYELHPLDNGRIQVRIDGDVAYMIAEKRFGIGLYDPIHDDAQAMALVRKFRLIIAPHNTTWDVGPMDGPLSQSLDAKGYPDLNRAICECVAKMQSARQDKVQA